MSEVRAEKMGIPLAMTYATMQTPPVHENQMTQCCQVLDERCGEPRRTLTKMYLAANCLGQIVVQRTVASGQANDLHVYIRRYS